MILLLSISLFLLTILVIILVIKLNWNSLISLILIPFLIFNIGFSWYSVNELWGQARAESPPKDAEILYMGIQKPWVYMLVKEKSEENNREPLFFKIPYSIEIEKEMAKAQKELKNGQKIFLNDKIKKNQEKETHFEWYKWNHLEAMPKDPRQ